jgi:zinc protease
VVNLKKSDFVASRLIDEYVFGFNHPYGTYSTIEDYDALQREDLLQFYNQYYRNGACIIFVSGKLPANIGTLLNNHLGRLPIHPADPKALKPIQPQPAAEKKYRIINDPNGVQGAIRMARPFYNRHHPDMQPALVLNNVFGGFFGSRLMSNIREDKGYTYGIQSYVQNHINNTAWLITTEAGRDVCEATIKEVYHEMQRLREEKIDDDEMELVRNFMMGSILADLDGPFHISSRWKNLVLNGLEGDYFYNSMNLIRNITPTDIQTLAQRYLNEEDFYELVVI